MSAIIPSLYNPGVAKGIDERALEELKLLRADICLLRDDMKSIRELIVNNKRSEKPKYRRKRPGEA